MPIPQVTFGQYMAPGFAGMFYDSGFTDTMSYSAEGAIPYGSFVKLGTNKERQVLAPTTAAGQTALLIGVAVASAMAEQAYPSLGAPAAYAPTQTVSTLKDGRIWVNTNDAVVAGAYANFVLANGTVTDEAVGAGVEAFTQMTVKFITGTTAAGLAVVEIAPK